jgi:hypothetical protein
LLLRQFGLPGDDPRARDSCRLFLDEGLAEDGGIDLSATQHRSETCITGFALTLLSWFGVTDPRRERLVDFLLHQQMADGGWNCQRDRGATHSSLHTTINVLDGLQDYTNRIRTQTQACADVDADIDTGVDASAGRAGSSCSRTGCSRRAGATTFFSAWTTSRPPRRHATTDSATPST